MVTSVVPLPSPTDGASSSTTPNAPPRRNSLWNFGARGKRRNKRKSVDEMATSSARPMSQSSSQPCHDPKTRPHSHSAVPKGAIISPASSARTSLVAVKKRVHFPSHNDQLVQTIPVDARCIEQDEANKLWYQQSEFFKFEREVTQVASEYRKSKRKIINLENSTGGACGFTLRGIEHLCDNKLRVKQREEHWQVHRAINAEMTHQLDTHTYPNHDRFHTISCIHSRMAKERAVHQGLEDERALRPKVRMMQSWANRWKKSSSTDQPVQSR